MRSRRRRPATTSSRRGSDTSAARPSCPNLLRQVADAPARASAPQTGQDRERGAPGARARDRAPSTPSSPRRSSTGASSRTAIDVTLPADPLPNLGGAAPAHPDPAGDRGGLHRARLRRRGGPRGRDRLLQLHRAQHAVDASLAAKDRHLLRDRSRCCCAPTRARSRSARWSSIRRRSTSSSPGACTGPIRRTPRTRRSSTRSRASPSTPT